MVPFKDNVEQYNTFVTKEYKKVATLEFSRDRKSMSILVKGSDGKNRMFIKGAPDYLLDKSKKCINQNGEVVAFSEEGKKKFKVVAYDFGVKKNILRNLSAAGCSVTVVPASTSAEEALAMGFRH